METTASITVTPANATTAGADHHCEIIAPVTVEKAFEKIGRVPEWWAKNFEGRAQRLDDVFTVRFGETFVTFRVTEVVPNAKIVWTVTDCYLHWLQDKTEWTGTNLVWKLSEKNHATTIRFAHLAACRTYPHLSVKIAHPERRPMACADFD